MRDWPLVERAFLEAALSRNDWGAALDVVSRTTSSTGAILFPDPRRISYVPSSEAMGPSTEIYFRDKWNERDERWAGLSHLKSYGITTEADFTSPELMRRSPYYEEFLRPLGLRWFAAVLIRSGSEVWSLSLQRSIEQGPFQESELQQLRSLAGRLDAAADIARALGTAQVGGAARAFEHSETAAVFMSSAGNIVRTNAAAEILFSRGDIRSIGGRLAFRSSAATGNLGRALREVLETRVHQSSKLLLVPRLVGRGLVARIIRFDGALDNPFSQCQAVAVFRDLDNSERSGRQDWADLFGITPAEARLIDAMLRGLSLEQAADYLGVTKETARTHIKNVFAKTQTSRQGELIALLTKMSV